MLKPGIELTGPDFCRSPLMPLPAFSPFVRSLARLAVCPVVLAAAAVLPPRAYDAIRDFVAVGEPFAPSYPENKAADAKLHGLAVNPKQAGERFAAAELAFAGPAGNYSVRLLAVAEEDGESVYELHAGTENFGRRTNPVVQEKRVPVTHVWTPVSLAPGTRLRVLFAGRSNGRYPEGSAFAWSRGRWRALEIVPLPEPSR